MADNVSTYLGANFITGSRGRATPARAFEGYHSIRCATLHYSFARPEDLSAERIRLMAQVLRGIGNQGKETLALGKMKVTV